MNFGDVVFLGILQGVTEFFPVSSSGHLLLAENFLGLDVENLKAFDVVLHAGTLLALIALFWKEWWGMVRSFWFLLIGSKEKVERDSLKLFLKLAVATIPAAFVGLFFGDWIDEFTRGEQRVTIVASFFVIVAGLLVLAEWLNRRRNKMSHISTKEKIAGWKQVAWMGFSQAFALLPGISRSGITIATGMSAGLSRSAAAKFSFLMLAPATAGAVILTSKKVFSGELALPSFEFTMVGFVVSAIASFIFASLLLRLVKRHSLIWFAVYLLVVAVVLI